MIKKIFNRLFQSPEGRLSLTKAGSWITGLCATAVSLCYLEIIVLPKGVFAVCVIIGIAGGKLTIDGMRDATGKK